MTGIITFDDNLEIGYVFLYPGAENVQVAETVELKVNPFINLDLDEQGNIIGIELFKEPVVKKYEFAGVSFCFSDQDYKHFIGFDVLDLNRYSLEKLYQLVK